MDDIPQTLQIKSIINLENHHLTDYLHGIAIFCLRGDVGQTMNLTVMLSVRLLTGQSFHLVIKIQFTGWAHLQWNLKCSLQSTFVVMLKGFLLYCCKIITNYHLEEKNVIWRNTMHLFFNQLVHVGNEAGVCLQRWLNKRHGTPRTITN